MICEFCHNIPQHPPCQACGGSGIIHCCDGPVGGPNDIIGFENDPPFKKIGDIIPAQFRNNGYSAGLHYPYIYGKVVGDQWIIWHRHSGEVVYIEESKFPASHEYRVREESDRWNKIGPHDPAINVLHDMET